MKLESADFDRFNTVNKAGPRNEGSDQVRLSVVDLPTSYPPIRSMWHRILGRYGPYSNLNREDPKTPT